MIKGSGVLVSILPAGDQKIPLLKFLFGIRILSWRQKDVFLSLLSFEQKQKLLENGGEGAINFFWENCMGVKRQAQR